MLPARHVRILGSTELWWDGAQVSLGGGRGRALVAALALQPGSVVSRERLAESVWGAEAADAQRGRLDVQVSRLRRALRDVGADPQLIQTAGAGYRLALAPSTVDAFVAEAALARARGRLAAGDARGALGAAYEARELWRGPSLADLPDNFEAVRLEELRRGVEEEIAEARLALGEAPALIAELEAAAAREPLRERLHGQLMRALYAAGREAEALAVYDGLRARLADELGIDPPAALRELHGRILRQEPAIDPLPARAKRAARPSRWPRRVIAGAAAAAVVAAGGVAAALGAFGGSSLHGTSSLASALHPTAVAILDARDGRLLAQAAPAANTASAGTGYTLLAFGSAWAAGENGTVTQVDPTSGDVRYTFPLGGFISQMAAGRGDIWVASDANYLVRIQPETHTTVKVPLDSAPPARGPATGANGLAYGAGAFWLARSGREVERLDPVSGRITAHIPVPGANSVAFGAGHVWVSDKNAGVLSRIDPRTNRVTARVSVPTQACCLAAAPDGVFVSSYPRGLVSRISRDGRVVDSFHVDGPASDIAYGDGRLWISGLASGLVTSIDIASGARHDYDTGATVGSIAAGGGRVLVAVNADAHGLLEKVRGPVLRVLMPADFFIDVDPATPGLGAPTHFERQLARVTCARMFSSPDEPAPTGAAVVPELSVDGGTVSADGVRWTFLVRRGFRFSPPSNAEVTASTVAHTIERALSPVLEGSVGARLLGRELRTVRADGDTLEIVLRRPVPDLPARLAASVFCVVPDGTPAQRGGVPDPLPSAGPYYIAARSSFYVLLRNPGYGGSRKRFFAAIHIDEETAPALALAHLRDGRGDLVLSDEPHAGLTSTPVNATLLLRVGPRLRGNARLLRAAAGALDRSTLADLLGALPATRLLPPGLASGAPELEAPASPAGRASGRVTVADCGGGCTEFADEVVGELERAGLDARTVSGDADLSLDHMDALDPDAADFLALGLREDAPPAVRHALTLSGAAREAAAQAADLDLSHHPSVAIPIAHELTAEALSRRLACVRADPAAPATNIATLCLR
jgi:DNA-binding SARP family transcriptional activator/streptogramin lyase